MYLMIRLANANNMFNFDLCERGKSWANGQGKSWADGQGSLLTYGALCCSQTKKCTREAQIVSKQHTCHVCVECPTGVQMTVVMVVSVQSETKIQHR